MANGRNKTIKGDTGRDGGGFVALPWSVLDCIAYACLSHIAKALLFEVARQFVKDNNGRLLISAAHMKKRGWYSSSVIQKAKLELIEAGFIFETVKGHRPNKASWYAVTWRILDRLQGYDAGTEQLFQRGAYRFATGKPKRPPPKCKNPKKIKVLNPPHGIESALIVPHHGIESALIVPHHGIEADCYVPCDGTIRPTLSQSSIPPHGYHLDMPSIDDNLPSVELVLNSDTRKESASVG